MPSIRLFLPFTSLYMRHFMADLAAEVVWGVTKKLIKAAAVMKT